MPPRRIGRIRPTDIPACTASVVEGSPGIEINTHVGVSGIDHNQGGVIATAARAVNVIDAVCRAPSGILAAHDLRPTDHVRRRAVVIRMP